MTGHRRALLLVLLCGFITSGCLTSVTTIKVKPDGSGTIEQSIAMKAEAAAPAPTEEFSPQTVTVTAHVNALFNLK